jgi:hypothetical protein
MIHLFNQLFKFLPIIQVARSFRESLKPISRMMTRHPMILQCLHSLLSHIIRNLLLRQHADISTYPQCQSCGLGIAVESSRIKKYEVSGFCVYFDILAEGFNHFVLLWNDEPVLLMIHHLFSLEVLLMVKM